MKLKNNSVANSSFNLIKCPQSPTSISDLSLRPQSPTSVSDFLWPQSLPQPPASFSNLSFHSQSPTSISDLSLMRSPSLSKVGNTGKNTNEERKGGLTMKNSILRCAGSRAEPSCHVKVIPISQWVCKFLTLCDKATKRYQKSHKHQRRLFSIFG